MYKDPNKWSHEHEFPDSVVPPNIDWKKIDAIFAKEQITREDEQQLNADEFEEYKRQFSQKLSEYYGQQREEFVRQIEPVASENARNCIWEKNHRDITTVISKMMDTYGFMPSISDIAYQTDLSRETVRKHLREYAHHPLHLEEKERFSVMTSRLLAKAYTLGEKGNVRAMRLFLEAEGVTGRRSRKTQITTQNNYMQVHKTIFIQEHLQHLSPEQLNAIEEIVKAGLPKMEAGVTLSLSKGGEGEAGS